MGVVIVVAVLVSAAVDVRVVDIGIVMNLSKTLLSVTHVTSKHLKNKTYFVRVK